MSLKASDILGTSQVGVHLAMVGRVLFAPMQLTKKDIANLEDALGRAKEKYLVLRLHAWHHCVPCRWLQHSS